MHQVEALLRQAERLDRETLNSLVRVIEAAARIEAAHGEDAALALLDMVERHARGEPAIQ